MKVVLLTQFFPPEIGAAAQRMGSLARYLAKRTDLTVLAPIPSYPWGKIPDDYQYRKEERHVDGYQVERCRKSPHRRAFIFRLMSEIRFAWMVYRCLARQTGNDLLLVSSPSFLLGLVAIRLHRKQDLPYVFDVRDLYPDVLIEAKYLKPGFLFGILKRVEKRIYRDAQVVSIVNSDWETAVAKHARRVIHVPNGLDFAVGEAQDDSNFPERWKPLLNGRPVIVYAGNLGRLYNFKPLLESAQYFAEKQQPILFLIIGEGDQRKWLEAEIRKSKLPNIVLHEPIQPGELRRVLQQCRVGYIGLDMNAPSLKTSVPNKIYEYLQAGLGIVGFMPGGIPESMSGHDRIFLTDPGNLAGIQAAFEAMCQDLPKSDKRWLRQFSRENHFQRLWQAIQSSIAG